MNKAEQWRCPDCDTLNSGRSCLVCGKEAPAVTRQGGNSESGHQLKSTIPQPQPKTDKDSKGLIIALVSVIGALITAIIVVCIIAFGGSDSNRENSAEAPAETAKETEEEETEDEPEEETLVHDSIFGMNFDITANKRDMEKQPDFSLKTEEDFVYSVPANFKGSDGKRYMAYDQTGHLRFNIKSLSGETPQELLDKERKTFNGRVLLEADEATADGYSLWTVKDKVVYYVRGLVRDGVCISFVFVYPETYRDIYDDYINEIVNGFRFVEKPDEVEVIEENVSEEASALNEE